MKKARKPAEKILFPVWCHHFVDAAVSRLVLNGCVLTCLKVRFSRMVLIGQIDQWQRHDGRWRYCACSIGPVTLKSKTLSRYVSQETLSASLKAINYTIHVKCVVTKCRYYKWLTVCCWQQFWYRLTICKYNLPSQHFQDACFLIELNHSSSVQRTALLLFCSWAAAQKNLPSLCLLNAM